MKIFFAISTTLLGTFATALPTSSQGQCEVHVGKNSGGHNLHQAVGVSDAAGCCDSCTGTAGCVGYTWVGSVSECWLKDQVGDLIDQAGTTSGSVGSPQAQCEVHVGKNSGGHNLHQAVGVSDAAGCCDACSGTAGCIGYTWVGLVSECWLKDQVGDLVDETGTTSGSVGSSPSPAPSPIPTPSPSPTPSGGQPILRKGWNLGNTLEGGNQPRAEWIFESVKSKGFDWVRIPVNWGGHSDSSGNVNSDWMSQVEETVRWANKHGLVALINTHHEDWFDNGGDLNRLKNIWTQIAQHFASFSDSDLVFEIFNEPNHMSLDTLNQMNSAVLPIIRQSNPTRLVFLGGLAQMGRWWINSNPDAMHIPQGDSNIGLTVHSYDPWAFAGDHPSSFAFSDSDADEADNQQGQLATWAQQHGIKQVVLNEFGVTNDQTNKNDRLKYYRANSQACVNHGQGYAIWDDNGWWQIFNRGSRTWEEDVLQQLASFPERVAVSV